MANPTREEAMAVLGRLLQSTFEGESIARINQWPDLVAQYAVNCNALRAALADMERVGRLEVYERCAEAIHGDFSREEVRSETFSVRNIWELYGQQQNPEASK